MDDYDPAAMARRLSAAHANETDPSTSAPEPLVKPEDTPLVQTNLRPSQVAALPKAEEQTTKIVTSAPSAEPSIASLSLPKADASQVFNQSTTPDDQTAPETQNPTLKPPKSKKAKAHKPKNIPALVLLSVFGVLLLAGVGYFVYFYYLSDSFTGQQPPVQTAEKSTETETPTTPTSNSTEQNTETPTETEFTPLSPTADEGKNFSRLSGEELKNLSDDSAPTFCVQIPNGVDGARPQVGLNSAKIVFEAIAEAGITRFAAVFQNPPQVVGPIRSLRIYYLNWDTPFDCIVTHAGGADDALSALRSNNYRELDESYDYMYRQTNSQNRLWNNLFALGSSLKSYAQNMGYLSSDIKSFPRYTPTQAEIDKINMQVVTPLVIDIPATGDTSELQPKTTKITFKFGDRPTFNPVFSYDSKTNSYLRVYESGEPHTVLDCSGLESTTKDIVPETECQETQLSPTTIIAMRVQEKVASYDNYHEDIASIGAGDAIIFQNGGMVFGTWEKASAGSQIIFRDMDGKDLKLVPGQTWISAIPPYGDVYYE